MKPNEVTREVTSQEQVGFDVVDEMFVSMFWWSTQKNNQGSFQVT